MATMHHAQLNATFNGVTVDYTGTKVNKFKGIKYAHISARFERARPISGEELSGNIIDATQYGPRCPQVDVDVRHLLRIPEDFEIKEEVEDEFECLNLDVTVPTDITNNQKLPVLVWIYGGSQAVTFCSSASGICDTTRIVAESAKAGKPIIMVAMNYRLNIFGFGDGKGTAEVNLSLKDQALAIDWVRRYIQGFGGDPENITLCGESAGAVYVHAHLITGPPVKRAILMSGSLYLSPPMPVQLGKGLLEICESRVQELEGKSLRECSQKVFKQMLTENNLSRCWMQEEDVLANWENMPERVDEVMIGETEFESVIWRRGIETLSPSDIISIFTEPNPELGDKIRKAYHISTDRPTSSTLGALDLLHDTKFTLPTELVSEKLIANNKKVYRYLFDEVNPWQASSRAHHAVDILFLFGTMDFSHNPSAEALGEDMRKRWISFVSGREEPWSELSATKKMFAFGPYGESKEIDQRQLAARRRVHVLGLLREVGPQVYGGIANKLAAGKISLLN
ncbi:carboxylesterase, putative [Talaromyces stipitatus ATCC 10500]|uniref:Carboxylic ester hydrolase n=1 Tax=Talaromyces stipitatus (strain ATCC 10500 / CBS 375.48 / QM 6759 / NRRL 1006) TaxID=441959 RepID=B8MRL3_TALSN|nr:carboxylesterase, putative [Talaromyces stipitatus ATCC 10500]EED13170.1 carboxylesterase, putative [Talaromyces stipitatus ATCC 10500]